MASKKGNGVAWTESQLRKYDFPTEPIKRISVSDPKVDEYVSSGVCTVPCHKEIYGLCLNLAEL